MSQSELNSVKKRRSAAPIHLCNYWQFHRNISLQMYVKKTNKQIKKIVTFFFFIFHIFHLKTILMRIEYILGAINYSLFAHIVCSHSLPSTSSYLLVKFQRNCELFSVYFDTVYEIFGEKLMVSVIICSKINGFQTVMFCDFQCTKNSSQYLLVINKMLCVGLTVVFFIWNFQDHFQVLIEVTNATAAAAAAVVVRFVQSKIIPCSNVKKISNIQNKTEKMEYLNFRIPFWVCFINCFQFGTRVYLFDKRADNYYVIFIICHRIAPNYNSNWSHYKND